MIQRPNFYKLFVVRNTGQFRNPPLPKLERLELPPLSMVHYVPQSLTNIWPSEDWYMYQKNEKPIRINHHMDLFEPAGNPKIRPGDWKALVREFRNRNPRFRPAIALDEMKAVERQIVTQSYGMLFERWRYQRSVFSNINRWTNIFSTLLHTAGDAVGSGYNQYLEVLMPKQLPRRDLLEKTEHGWTPRNMSAFNSYPMFMLHHLWVWLGENRHKGLFAKHFTKGYKGMYLILRDEGRFAVLDMERIDAWRNPSRHEQKLNAEMRRANPGVDIPPLPKGTFAPQMMQKLLLRMFMSLMACRTEDIPESLGDDDTVDAATANTVTKDLDAVTGTAAGGSTGPATDTTDGGGDAEIRGDDEKVKPTGSADGGITEEEAYSGYDESIDNANLMAEIDKDIEALDVIGADGADENGDDSFAANDDINVFLDADDDGADINSDVDETSVKDPTIDYFPDNSGDAFKRMCDVAAENGDITANEYRKLLELGDESNQLPAPLGATGSVTEFMKVTEEETKLDPEDPEIKIPDMTTVTDKSMLESTLQVMDKRYTEEFMQKDVAGMVMGIRSAGIAVKNYDVQEVEDITGTHYEYTVQVKPIVGASSTLRFKIPKVEEDGNFLINGVRYRLRKQRGD